MLVGKIVPNTGDLGLQKIGVEWRMAGVAD